jgi:hypothetical protein
MSVADQSWDGEDRTDLERGDVGSVRDRHHVDGRTVVGRLPVPEAEPLPRVHGFGGSCCGWSVDDLHSTDKWISLLYDPLRLCWVCGVVVSENSSDLVLRRLTSGIYVSVFPAMATDIATQADFAKACLSLH